MNAHKFLTCLLEQGHEFGFGTKSSEEDAGRVAPSLDIALIMIAGNDTALTHLVSHLHNRLGMLGIDGRQYHTDEPRHHGVARRIAAVVGGTLMLGHQRGFLELLIGTHTVIIRLEALAFETISVAWAR